MSKEKPIISVVIPTRNRPESLLRAIRTVLTQTWSELEVIVVVDGPDPETLSALAECQDDRVRVIALNESVGGSEARNVGARNAKGDWVALLDDDDTWLPEKLASQMKVAGTCSKDSTFIGSAFIERSSTGDRVLPKGTIDTSSHISEVLFCRRTLASGTGYVQTSTWLISRKLLLDFPFTKGLKRNQDADWMLHALSQPGVSLRLLNTPLAILYDDDNANRVSKKADWRFHYDWALANRQFFTRKAMAFFLLTTCVHDAVSRNEGVRVILNLLRNSFRHGTPTTLSLCFFFYYWLFPDRYRRRCRRYIQESRACV
jgi:glycosyltransferase involved in cell wall biosynthesis